MLNALIICYHLSSNKHSNQYSHVLIFYCGYIVQGGQLYMYIFCTNGRQKVENVQVVPTKTFTYALCRTGHLYSHSHSAKWSFSPLDTETIQ